MLLLGQKELIKKQQQNEANDATNSDNWNESLDSRSANNNGKQLVHRVLDRFKKSLTSSLLWRSRSPFSCHNAESDLDDQDAEPKEPTPTEDAEMSKQEGGSVARLSDAAAVKLAEPFYTVDTETYNLSSLIDHYAARDKRILPKMMKCLFGGQRDASRTAAAAAASSCCCVHPLLDKVAREFCHRVGFHEVSKMPPVDERMFLWLGRARARAVLDSVGSSSDSGQREASLINQVRLDNMLTDLQCLCSRLDCCVAREGQIYQAHYCPDPNKIEELCSEPEGHRPRIVFVDRQQMCRHIYLGQDFGAACEAQDCPMYGKSLCSCFQMDMFIPDTIVLATKKKFEEVRANLAGNIYGAQRWLIRAASLKGGNGVQLLDTASELETFMRYDLNGRLRGQFFVLQRVPRNPMLLDDRRFELRMFLLVSVLTERRVVAFLHPGYLRLAQSFYQRDSNDLRCHLAGPLAWDPDYSLYKKLSGKAAKQPADYCRPYSEAREHLRLPRIACEPELDAQLRATVDGDRFLLRLSRIVNSLAGQMDSLVCGQPGSWQLFGIDLMLDNDRELWLHDVMTYPCPHEPDPRSGTQNRLLPGVLTEALALVLELNQRDQDCRGRRQWTDLPDVPVNRPGLIAAQRNFVWMYSTDTQRLVSYKDQPRRSRPPHWYMQWRTAEDFNDYIAYLKSHRVRHSNLNTDSTLHMQYGRKSFTHSPAEQFRKMMKVIQKGDEEEKQDRQGSGTNVNEANTNSSESELIHTQL